MANTIRRVFSGLLVFFALVAFWGAPDWLPFDRDGAMNAAISADTWIIDNASLPGFFLLFAATGLVLLVPDLWRGAAWISGKLTGAGPLRAIFDPARQECRDETMFTTGQKAVFFRILVVNDSGGPKIAVNGRLAEVTRESDNFKQITHVLLGWAPHTLPPVTQRDISPKGREILDCFYIADDGDIGPPLHNWPRSFPPEMFAEAGTYLVKILIDSDANDPLEVLLRLTWAGDWKTASVGLAK